MAKSKSYKSSMDKLKGGNGTGKAKKAKSKNGAKRGSKSKGLC